MNQTIKKAIINSLIFLAPSILIALIVFQYEIEPLIIALTFSPYLILCIFAFIYNSGRLLGFFPKQPKNTHTWVAIYMGKRIGSTDINSQSNYSVLETLYINRSFRSLGVGTLLVQTLASEEIKPLYVQPERHAASFCEKLGFVPVNQTDLPTQLKERNSLFTSKYMVLR
ncbi:GNAT family N-acetyltransferase [Dulcicalothrix desertica]|uniref:GNAT family N-acetyltransferase n=1 Tax=Dulcicalothrix desertica TaxID=32056 RepID=UPI0013157281|nr:GNAT family N-acetyltransferase [Dulcicalothrix desertica]